MNPSLQLLPWHFRVELLDIDPVESALDSVWCYQDSTLHAYQPGYGIEASFGRLTV